MAGCRDSRERTVGMRAGQAQVKVHPRNHPVPGLTLVAASLRPACHFDVALSFRFDSLVVFVPIPVL